MPQKDTPFPVLPASGLASRRVQSLILLVVWLFFLIWALRVLGPDSVYTNFTADCAIPILMANDERPITVFDTYYYAADRYGGWPFLIAKMLHQNVRLHWSDQTLHYAKTIWMFFGLLILAALNARAAPAVLVSSLIALCLEPTSRRLMFDVGQAFAWQLPPLLLAWFCLRHLLAQRLRSDEATEVRVHGIFWSASFYLSAFFAIWISVASAPLLAVLLTLEALRSHFLFQKTITKRRIGLALLLLLAATASEFLMKKNYHRHSLKHFGNDFKTGMALDFGYLYENLLTNWHSLVQFKMFFLIVVALCFVVGTAGLLLYARIVNKGPLLTRVFSFFEDETLTMIVALTAMAAMNFLLTISVNHVRLNFYNVRFHALTYLFAAIAGLLTIYLAIRVLANRFAVTRPVLPLVLVCVFIWLGVEFPRRALSETYKLDRQTALALSQKAPGSLLMGGYWETYLLAGLQPTNTMTPLPVEGVLNRMPWTVAMLQDSQQVLIEYRSSGVVQKDSLPPNELLQYGNLLKLQEARFYENGPYAFALYVNERSKP
jgi:hypothetical protein